MKLFLEQAGYRFDSINGIWCRPGFAGIAYSDGSEAEQRIADAITAAADLRVLSPELKLACTDWPSLYHLSGARANLLRPFEHSLGNAKVLEIGAGCGALTRFMGECGADVLALEGSLKRAAIARARTRDLANVTVLAEDFNAFDLAGQYDIVTLIGVLEYANLFAQEEQPALGLLKRARAMLKPGGRLILAIENQLGLKYFAGAAEDHIGRAMYGIEGRYRTDQPQTFGRKVLGELLVEAGLPAYTCLAPLPDYKLPVSILTEAGMADAGFDSAVFAWQSVRRDNQLPNYASFCPELAWPEVFRNGLAMDLANAFLVVASTGDAQLIAPDILAYHYSTERVPRYCKETRFRRSAGPDIEVAYRRLEKASAAESGTRETPELVDFRCPDAGPYHRGIPLSWHWIQSIAKDDWTIDQIADTAKHYFQILKTLAARDGISVSLESSASVLPGKYFDLIPQNIIILRDGTPEAIDMEWHCRTDIEIGHMLYRSLILLLSSVTKVGVYAGREYTRMEFLHAVFSACGLPVETSEFARYAALEAEIQSQVTGKPAQDLLEWQPHHPLRAENLAQAFEKLGDELRRHPRPAPQLGHQIALNAELRRTLDQRDDTIKAMQAGFADLSEHIEFRNAQLSESRSRLAALNDKIAAIENSKSWRLTSPLRALRRSALNPASHAVDSNADGPSIDRLCANLESPAHGQLVAGTQVFSGWCFHTRGEIRQLRLISDVGEAVATHGMPRTDVAAHYTSHSQAANSGFQASWVLQPGKHTFWFEAELIDGTVVRLHNSRTFHVRAAPLLDQSMWQKGLSKAQRYAAFSRHAHFRLKDWHARHQRLPRIREWKKILRVGATEYARLRATPSLPSAIKLPPAVPPYRTWCDNNRLGADDLNRLRTQAEASISAGIRISIVMPVYNPDPESFRQAIASLQSQLYSAWELCIADDCSPDPWIVEELQRLQNTEPRIKATRRSSRGNIGLASNTAAELASGDWLLFMDQDDLLSPDALAEIAIHLHRHPDTDLLYSDDDKIANGIRYAPQFKPDWSPELLLSYMYLSHALCIRRTLFDKVGGIREGFDGAQDYDLALRASELADKIHHIPRILYHWRAAPGSTASGGDAKPYSLDAGTRAVQDALNRRGCRAVVSRPEWAITGHLGIYQHTFADEGASVSILIPSRNNKATLQRCLESIGKTSYRNYRVTVIDNMSDDPDTLAYLEELSCRVIRIANPNRRFSFSHINNRAAEQADADYLLFLNDDTEVLAPGWLSQMVGYAQLPGVGAVGAKLLYPDGRVQHAGAVHGYHDGLVGHAFKLAAENDNGYLSYAAVTRNYSAVTAACLLTPRKLFLSMLGFDEAAFAVAYNDVDYCYRLIDAGYRCVYAPSAQLLHHEGLSRGRQTDPNEVIAFRNKYGSRKDPYYNENLSLEDEQFRIDPKRYRPTLPKRPIKALMCAFNLNWEGAPYCQFELTCALKKMGILDPTVYSPTDGPLRRAYEDAGIAVVIREHPLTDVSEVEEFDAAIARFAAWLGDIRCELVYGNTLQTFHAICAARQAGLPSIWNIRESEPWHAYFDFLPAPIRHFAIESFQYPHATIFVSHATMRSYAPLNTHNNFRMIHDGFDSRTFRRALDARPRAAARHALGIAEDEVAVLLLGTVCERKGQIDLVEALRHVDSEMLPRIRCLIVGDRPGAYSQALKLAIQSLGADRAQRIELVEETGDAAIYYSAADVFVCTSRIESYPRVILEAMVAGLPIVSTPCFGIVEQLAPGINGEFYEAGDHEGLARTVERFAMDSALRRKYAENSVLVFETLLGFDAMAKAYADTFVSAHDAHAASIAAIPT